MLLVLLIISDINRMGTWNGLELFGKKVGRIQPSMHCWYYYCRFFCLLTIPRSTAFVFLLFIMIPLATTELGTDSWISD